MPLNLSATLSQQISHPDVESIRGTRFVSNEMQFKEKLKCLLQTVITEEFLCISSYLVTANKIM